jgi:hypothetical protein
MEDYHHPLLESHGIPRPAAIVHGGWVFIIEVLRL